ncbi:MAG: IS4 family transposase [Spartobacteria bacterium]
MKHTTPFLPAFGPLLFGRRPKSEQAKALEKLKSTNTLGDLKAVCADSIPDELLSPPAKGHLSRRRQYSLPVVFWAFLAQILTPNTSCREIVRRVQAWRAGADSKTDSSRKTDSSHKTVAYCKARAKLPEATLAKISKHIADRCERNTPDSALWKGRHVKIIDGTTVSMPDTPLNQKDYPQPSSQKPGCGFPLMRLVGLFSLASGALLEFATGNNHIHETLLFRRLWGFLEKKDILLADRGFCSYYALAQLKEQGVDSVIRLHQSRKSDMKRGKKLGPNDRLQTWAKPLKPPTGVSEEEFENVPEKLQVRVVKIQFDAKGFRSQSCLIVTTLLDTETYPVEALGELYYQRWTIELHFRELKTFLGMEILRCRSPHMIKRELQMHFIAYNVIRHVMQSAAIRNHKPLARISFKGSLDTLRHWAPVLDAARNTPRKQRRLLLDMLRLIAADIVPERPNRSEPRAKKRRAKNYHLLTKPRKSMGHVPRRNRPGKNPRKNPKTA